MAYIGNTVQNQGFTPAIDYFNGNGVTVTFTLSRPVASVAQLIVAIDNVIQNPSTAFSVSGNSITFTSAPLSGTNNIWVEYTSLITTYNAISQDPTVIGDLTATGGYLAEGDFGNTFSDGTIVDYVTGTARITTSAGDAITFYNGGTNARNALMTLAANGNVGIGTTSPATKLHCSSSPVFDIRVQNTAQTNQYMDIGTQTSLNAHYIFGYGTYPILFATNSTERMRVNAGAPILCLAGGNTSATGTGIAFPATQSASSDANTLDDYEEGTWTPTIVTGGGTISGTGRYTKVGRIVQFSIDAQFGGTRNGDALIVGGLPFTNIDWTACSFYCQTFFPEGTQQASGFVRATATHLAVQLFGSDAVGTDFGNGYANWAGTYATS